MATDIYEAKRRLQLSLGDHVWAQYFQYLRQWFSFDSPLTKEEFDGKVRALLHNPKQIQYHNQFLLAIMNKALAKDEPEHHPDNDIRQSSGESAFEVADQEDYIHSTNPNRIMPSEYSYPQAAAELFVPYSGFINCRINIVAWECGMDGAKSDVTPVVVEACQSFLKNIITAMMSKAKGYKIRDGKFQYGFNMPVPDPFIRNSNNVIDDTEDVNLVSHDGLLLPKPKHSLERIMRDRAYAYGACKKMKTSLRLSSKLLYETVRDNPALIGQLGIHSVQTIRLSLHQPELSSTEDEEDSD